MELWIGAINLGLLYAFMTLGVFITFRIHNFPDITVDGSFTTGAAVAAVLIVSGFNPFVAIGAAFIAGACTGAITALIHTRFNINGLLAGILVMTGLYSVNLHIMGRSNIPLLNQKTFLTYMTDINPGIAEELWVAASLLCGMALFWPLLSLFFKTDLGIAMRITGNNSDMAAANGVNVGRMTVFGVALANGLVGASGSLVAQYQGFADIGMGIGTIVIGLAAVIIGESIFKMRSMYAKVLSVIIGSVTFRLLIAVALYVGMNPIDLKLLTALFVLFTLVLSKGVSSGHITSSGLKQWLSILMRPKALVPAAVAIALIVGAVNYFSKLPTSESPGLTKHFKIGFIQINENGLLNITRDSFVEEMRKLGYRNGENCTIILKDANSDLPTVNTILDSFREQDVDIVVPISTPCAQVAINKVKDRPIVFATVANPFIIGAGTSERDHLPNVTGVYGWVPMDRTMKMVRAIFPGSITVGSIWDPSHDNSVFNVEGLQKVIKSYKDVDFKGATINSSADVYQAALSLVQKDVDVFVLSPDNIVYNAFESVVKAARIRDIPIFLSDVERLADGALGALGYDYTHSGIQAAHLVDRVLKGESPGNIPFERYKKLTIGINMDIARELKLTMPAELLAKTTIIHDSKSTVGKRERKIKTDKDRVTATEEEKRLVLFLFSDHTVITETANGVMDELQESGMLSKYNITVDTKNAQNEFYMAQSIVQDIVRRKYDYIITLSTPALQVTAQGNKKIPHIFGAVTDPYRMGIAKSSSDHLPQITGLATLQPVMTTFKVMREIFPKAKRVGIVWNSAEASSETCTYVARDAVKKYGFELLEANVSSTAEVIEAVNSLISRRIDLFITSGDNTVLLAFESIAKVMREHRIPYFTNGPSDVLRGAFLSIGADYYEVGKETARVAARVISGEKTKDIPIKDCAPEKMYVNNRLAKELGIKIPYEVLKRASKVVN